MNHAKYTARRVLRSHHSWLSHVVLPRIHPPPRDSNIVSQLIGRIVVHCRRNNTTTTLTEIADETNRSLIRQHIRTRQAIQSEWLQDQIRRIKDTTSNQTFTQQEILDLLNAWVDQWKVRKSNVKKSIAQSPTDPYPISPSEMVNIILAANKTTTVLCDEASIQMAILSYTKLIDGIVEAAKANHMASGLASLAETTCLDPMIQLYYQQSPGDGAASSTAKIAATATTTLIQSFNKVITLYCQEKKVPAAEQLLYRFEKIIDEALRSSQDKDARRLYSIPVSTYGIVISGYAKSVMPREAEYILFARMIQKRKRFPRAHLFESCLAAWENAKTKDAGQRAEVLILRHQQWHESHPKQIDPPTAKHLLKAVNAWVNSRHPEAPSHIEKIIETMYVLECHDASILANAHLRAMKLWAWRADPQKCNASMEQIISKFGKTRIPPILLQRMYAARITAYARSKVASTQPLHGVIAELEEDGRTGTFGDLKYWDQSIYTAMFDSLAIKGQGADAESLLARLTRDSAEDKAAPKVNLKSYNSVLLAWSRSKDPDAAQRAEHVFLQMQKEQGENCYKEVVQPDVVSYNAVLAAMARAPVKSEALAVRGESYFQDIEDKESFRATTVTFNQALLLWWRVPNTNVIVRIDKLLERMSLTGIPPDTSTLQAIRLVVEAMDVIDDVERNRLFAKYKEKLALVQPQIRNKDASTKRM